MGQGPGPHPCGIAGKHIPQSSPGHCRAGLQELPAPPVSCGDDAARRQGLDTKPLSSKQKSCYSKVCRKCWQECNEGMGTCIASPGYALPGSVCTRVWDKQSDCSKSIKAFEIGGGSEYLNRDNKYHFAVAAWSQCAHGLTPRGRPW